MPRVSVAQGADRGVDEMAQQEAAGSEVAVEHCLYDFLEEAGAEGRVAVGTGFYGVAKIFGEGYDKLNLVFFSGMITVLYVEPGFTRATGAI